MTPPLAGQPGHGSTAFVRNQPVRIVDGRMEGGYTGVYELICPSCGDHPYLDYSEVPPRLQRLRGPRTLAAILAIYHEHLGPCYPNEDSAGSLGPGAAKIARCTRRRPSPPAAIADASWTIVSQARRHCASLVSLARELVRSAGDRVWPGVRRAGPQG
jgi:hypothetical protein